MTGSNLKRLQKVASGLGEKYTVSNNIHQLVQIYTNI